MCTLHIFTSFDLFIWLLHSNIIRIFCQFPLVQLNMKLAKYPPPIELCPPSVFLVFLHMFFGPAWFCIKLCSMVLHVLFYFTKELTKRFINNLITNILFLEKNSQDPKPSFTRHRSCYYPQAQIQVSRNECFLSYFNNFHNQKVKPCSRTARFSAGLHCQAQKGRRTVLDGGCLASRLRLGTILLYVL